MSDKSGLFHKATDWFCGHLFIIALISMFFALGLQMTLEYRALKKYYPEITWVDYIVLYDKMRITPD
jgi:hypothetical protein